MADVSSAKSMNVYHQAARIAGALQCLRCPESQKDSIIILTYLINSSAKERHLRITETPKRLDVLSTWIRSSGHSLFLQRGVGAEPGRLQSYQARTLSVSFFFLRGPGGPDSLAQPAGTSVLPLSSSWVSSQMQDLFSGSHSMGGMEGEILAAGSCKVIEAFR